MTTATDAIPVRSAAPVIRVQPSRGWVSINYRELKANSELLYFLIWRDIKVRYKQTVLGAAWAILQPVLTMVVFSIIFGRFAGIPSDGVPYPVFAFVALVPWTFFSNGLSQSSVRLVASADLIKKVYFPRLIIPVAAVCSGVVDFALAFLTLVCVMGYYRMAPTLNVFWLPLFVLLALITSLGVGLWLSALHVMFRDVQYVIPFLAQIWMYATPIAYPSSLVPEKWRILYGLNPMAGVVESFRWALLGTGDGPGAMVAVSALIALGLLITGAFYFRRMERAFADVI